MERWHLLWYTIGRILPSNLVNEELIHDVHILYEMADSKIKDVKAIAVYESK